MITRDHAWRMLGWRLRQAGIADAELDARLLTRAACNCDEIEMIREPGRMLSDAEVATLAGFEVRRLAHEPVSRILGMREFWGLPFFITSATLDPRPDSEVLVATALDLVPPDKSTTILDLGTGTGCLLVALLHERKEARGLGLDLSAEALDVARKNAMHLGVGQRASFRHAGWESWEGEERFDLVISNPPYIAAAEIETLEPEVRAYDPRLALDGGADGLDAYRSIARRLPGLLSPEGHAVIELGIGQADDVRDLMERSGLCVQRVNADIEGRPRALVAHPPRP